jgi:hypothetical protein
MLNWIKIDVKIDNETKRPPFFVGSMLRGALGMSLKRVVCINPSYKCEGCFAAKECLYHKFYEEKNVFHAYRLGITVKPENFDFSLYLFEEETKSLPYMLSAIKKMVEEQGFGKEQQTFRLKEIVANGQIVYDGRTFLSLEHIVPQRLKIERYTPAVELEFTMPLRIKESNVFAREGVQLHTLIGNIRSRYMQLKGEPRSRMQERVEGDITHQSLRFVEMQRYSNRQKTGMRMGGLKGKMIIENLDENSYRYLKIGEIIGAGKQTVFGLGSYIMKELT